MHALFVRAQCCTRMRSSASAAATAARTNGVAEASYRDEIRKAREPPRRRRPCKGVAASGSKLGDRAGDGVGLRNQRAGANRDSSRCVDKHSGQFIAEGGLHWGAISPIRPAVGMSAFCAQPTAGVDVKRTSRMAVPPPPQRSLLGHSGLAHAFENRLKRGEICGVVAHPRPRGSGA